MKVSGPWFDKGISRWIVNIYYDDGSRRTTTLARHRMEEHLGRRLTSYEHVDHIDDDCTNDDLDNLQILTPLENHRKAHGPPAVHVFECPECGKLTEKPLRFVLNNWKQGKSGPYCGKSCAGKASTRAGN